MVPVKKMQISQLKNLKATSTGFIASCPAHDDKKPSLSIDSRNGKLLVYCHAGCPQDRVMELLDSDVIGKHLANKPDSAIADEKKREAIRRVWEEAKPIKTSDLAATYLRNRGINLMEFPESLRFHPSVKAKVDEVFMSFPAMLARFDDSNGAMIQVHRTLLSADGRKANIESPKRMMSSPSGNNTRGGAIRLFPAGRQLGIAEGIESALACNLATSIPVWSCYSATCMESVVIPDAVEELYVFADHDSAGTKSARAVATRLARQKLKVKVLVPPTLGQDWLDVWNAHNDISNE